MPTPSAELAPPREAPHAIRAYWLTEAFYPPIVGGQELFAAQIVQALAARGIQMQVITRQSVPPSAARESIGRVPVRRFAPAGNLKGKAWRAVLPILGYLLHLFLVLVKESRRYDIVIVSGAKLMPMIVVPACYLMRKKCIVRVESFFELKEAVSSESLRDMGGFSARLIVGAVDGVRLFFLRRAHAVIAISAEIRAALLNRGIRGSRIHSISNAVDLQKFRPVSVADKEGLIRKLELPKGRLLAVFAGRLSRAKGLPMLIEAWPAIIARHPRLCLLVIGSGHISFDNCEAYVKDFASTHGLEDSVRFLGERSNIHEYLQAADLFVFPTEYEGFSLALVEAMGCQLPVVVTAVGAAPDLIKNGENGFLFPPKNAAAMSSAIDTALAAQPRWPQIAASARASVTQFDLAMVADRYLALCGDLADAPHDL
jgi:glycosyltransferase involved in cell wall biosynthesis